MQNKLLKMRSYKQQKANGGKTYFIFLNIYMRFTLIDSLVFWEGHKHEKQFAFFKNGKNKITINDSTKFILKRKWKSLKG